MKQKIHHLIRLPLALALATPFLATAQAPPDTNAAIATFAHAQQLCQADGSKAWGASLCGPMLVADPATRRFVANMDGVDSPLESDGAVFRGVLPDTVPIANTAVRWNGRAWTMLMAPVPQAEPALSILLMHEAWHRIQEQIGLSAVHTDQDQLGTEEGRWSLRLELRALASALSATPQEDQRRAIEDALAFRAWRQAQFPKAQTAEDAMERNEGIAEYTGRILSRDEHMAAHLVDHLHKGDSVSEYARSFAYYTGPAYGVLLDRFSPGWRENWDRREGLPQMLARALQVAPSPDAAALTTLGARYDGPTVRAQESARAQENRARVAALQARLVDAPVLVAPVSGANFSFDPNRVTPLPPQGAVYGVIHTATDWGVLEVMEGGLLSTDWSRLSVAYSDVSATPDGLKGNGWTLTLKPGWEVVPGERDGDWEIKRRTGVSP